MGTRWAVHASGSKGRRRLVQQAGGLRAAPEMPGTAELGEPGFSRTKRYDQSARLAAIMDAKQRCIGVDKETLGAQVAEKAATKEGDMKRDAMCANLANFHDHKLVMLEQQRREVKAEMARELVGFRAANQTKEGRREFDLSDSDTLKKSLPARVGDEDPRAGVSSLQMFDGEDLKAGERRKMQMAQQAAWVAQQTEEKLARTASEKEDKDGHHALVQAQCSIMNDVADLQEQAKAALRLETAEVNKMLAAQKREKETMIQEWEKTANEIDKGNVLASPYMMEDASVSTSSLGPHRVRPDHWKGMSEEQKAAVFAERATQREAMAAARTAEKEAENLYTAQQEAIRKTLEIKASEVEQFKAEQRASVAAFRQTQQAEKTARDATLKQVYTNVPTADFFAQFGTSAR